MQMSHDNKMTEVINEVKLKAFEAERTQMVYEETVRNLKDCQLENEKMSKKLEVIHSSQRGRALFMERKVFALPYFPDLFLTSSSSQPLPTTVICPGQSPCLFLPLKVQKNNLTVNLCDVHIGIIILLGD